MSIRELKEILASRGVDFSQVIEKSELEKLVAETQHLSQPNRSAGGGSSDAQPEKRGRSERGADKFRRLKSAADILGVAVDAPEEVVQAAHKALMVTHHPDRNPSDRGEHEQIFKDVRAAYELLSSVPHAKRTDYLRAASRKQKPKRAAEPRPPNPDLPADAKPADGQRDANPEAQREATRRLEERAKRAQQQQAPPIRPYTPSDPKRDPSKGGAQFHEILAAAARENVTRRGPPGTSENGSEADEPAGKSAGEPARAEESAFILAFEALATGAAKAYIFFNYASQRCVTCVCECGGLLRISDKELHSWGYRAGEQPARFKGACGEPALDPVQRAASRQAQVLRQAHAKANGKAMPKPVVV